MIVRPANDTDVDAVVALEQDNLGPDAWSRGLISEGLRGSLPTVGYLVVVDGDVPVGHAVVSLAGEVAELQRIAVADSHRRRGAASLLLDRVVLAAGAGGAEAVLLEVREDNAGAIAFYAARGFVELDRRRRYYQDGATAVVMRRPLT